MSTISGRGGLDAEGKKVAYLSAEFLIGRLVYRLMKEDDFFDVVAINDLSSSEELAYLLRYDTNHRTYDKDI